ncbi:hypothetical protein BC830DRAFT_1099912 [Chytriomyces sp. MP71]|nr:hypothetical protein BC830DRAFT_1099912 [Chytriomyces sp. MP71]
MSQAKRIECDAAAKVQHLLKRVAEAGVHALDGEGDEASLEYGVDVFALAAPNFSANGVALSPDDLASHAGAGSEVIEPYDEELRAYCELQRHSLTELRTRVAALRASVPRAVDVTCAAILRKAGTNPDKNSLCVPREGLGESLLRCADWVESESTELHADQKRAFELVDELKSTVPDSAAKWKRAKLVVSSICSSVTQASPATPKTVGSTKSNSPSENLTPRKARAGFLKTLS